MEVETLAIQPGITLQLHTAFVSLFGACKQGVGAMASMAPPSALCHGCQGAHADQVVHGCCNGEHPADACHPAMPRLPQQPHGLEPPKELLHAIAFPLTDSLARMVGCPAVDGAGPPSGMLGDMGGDL
jgi:hypothetical protein